MKNRVLSLIVGCVAMLSSVVASAQSLNTSYFMEGSYFRTDLNPALTPTRGFVAIPILSGVALDVQSNFLSVDNFFFKRDEGVVSAFHGSVSPEEFLGRLPSVEKLGLGLDMNVLSAGFFYNDMFWNFGVNLRANGDMTLSKDLFTALKTFGNGAYDLSGTELNLNAYAEVYVGTTYPVLDWIDVGARLKFLLGLCNASGSFDEISVNASPDSISGLIRGQLRLSGMMFSQSEAVAGEVISADMLSMSGAMGFGLGLDLGTEIRLLDGDLKLSAAVTDLGFIKWSKKGTVRADVNGDLYFNGVNFNTGEADSAMEFKAAYADAAADGYTTRLNCAINVGGEYNILDNRIGFGLMSHTEFCPTFVRSELTASVNFRPLKWLSASLSHTVFARNDAGVIGAALNIHPDGFNVFIGADYLDLTQVKYGTMNVPRRANSVNVYMGIGFNIGEYHGKTKTKAKTKVMEVAPDAATATPENTPHVIPEEEGATEATEATEQ